MTTHQKEQLNKMLANWNAAAKQKYLFGMVAGMIKNSVQRVIDGHNTLQEFEDVLIKAQPTKGSPIANEQFEKALDEVKIIIAGGSLN